LSRLRVAALLGLLVLLALLVGPTLATALEETLGAAAKTSAMSLPAALWIHSGVIALAAMVTALVLGTALAAWIVRLRRAWLRGFALLAAAFPFAVPMYVHGMAAWQVVIALGLYGEQTTEGPWTDLMVVGLVQGLRLSAVVCLLTVAGWQTIHARWLEAGLLAAPPRAVRWRLTLPLLAPFVGLGLLLTAIVSVTDVSVPLLFQQHTVLAVRLWDAHYRALDPSASWRAMVAPTLALLALVVLLLPALWRRAAPLLNARRDPSEIPRPRGGSWAVTLLGLGALVLANGSLIHLLRQVTNFQVLMETFRANTPLIWATAETAAGASAVALLAGMALAPWLNDRSGGLKNLILVTFATMILAIPGFLWASAAVTWWNQPGIRGAAYDSGIVRWLVLGGRLMAIPAVLLGLTLARQSKSQFEAATLAHLGRWRTWTTVTWPPLRRAAWIAFAFTALSVMGDLDAAIIMDLPGRTTLVVGLCNRLHISPRSPEVAMMAAVILATVVAVLAAPVAVSLVSRRVRRAA
jgi:ABC-type Fe3+ transport system permease subunit